MFSALSVLVVISVSEIDVVVAPRDIYYDSFVMMHVHATHVSRAWTYINVLPVIHVLRPLRHTSTGMSRSGHAVNQICLMLLLLPLLLLLILLLLLFNV